MSTILDKIIANTREELVIRKSQTAVKVLEKSVLFNRVPLHVPDYIRDKSKSGIIAEIKRQSPSRGVINDKIDVATVGKGYEAAGASCISVLTDYKFFGGKAHYLTEVKAAVSIPVLRKDFIIDEYQVIEAKAIGADMILLIAACLTPQKINLLARLSKSLGLSVLLEVHNEEELNRSLNAYVDLVGVNNRDLKNFEISLDASFLLAEKIPSRFLKISESGLHDPQVIAALRSAGYDGFLVGETFMKHTDPAAALAIYINKINEAQLVAR